MKQRREITCELLFIEIVAVGFLGIASVLFKENRWGDPCPCHYAVLGKPVCIFQNFSVSAHGFGFAALMDLFNVGLPEAGDISRRIDTDRDTVPDYGLHGFWLYDAVKRFQTIFTGLSGDCTLYVNSRFPCRPTLRLKWTG